MTDALVAEAGGIDAQVSAFAFQFWARDFYAAYLAHQSDRPFSPARYFLLCRAIELAAKTLHIANAQTAASNGSSTAMAQVARDLHKTLNHDLIAACDPTLFGTYGITMTPAEETALQKANAYYENKGFEYFWAKVSGFNNSNVHRSGPELALRGYPDRPDEAALRSVLEKLLALSF